MSKYVVTGGAGFIGSALVRGLLRQGAQRVIVIDNLLSGREENLEEVASSVDLERADIRCYDQIAPIVRGADVVFHEAAIPSVPRSIDDPLSSHEVNIDGTFQVLRACADGGVKRVVYAASSSAYGDTAVLRYFNVFGPRQDPSSPYSGVLSVFMKCLIERRAPTIFGDGEQSRDFTFVDDVVDLNLKAASAKGVAGRMYNGGNGGRVTLNQAWETLQKIEGVRIDPVYGPPRAGDVRDSQADTTLAVAELGHAPRYSFED